MRREARKGMVEVNSYEVNVERGERYWLVHVPAIGHSTQARSLREVELMARDLIAVMHDGLLDREQIELAIHLHLPDSVRQHLARAVELREQEAHVRQRAAQEARAAAPELAGQGLTMRDIGAAMGISHQRAQQLINA